MTELWQLYDEQGRPLVGIGGTKDEVYRNALLHGASHVWLWRKRDNQIEVLLQRRAAKKKTWPNLLDISAAGHIDLGETPLEAAMRETSEELGIALKAENVQLIGVIKTNKVTADGLHEYEFNWVYIAQYTESNSFVLQSDEVSELEWKRLTVFASEVLTDETSKRYVPQGERYYGFVLDALYGVNI